MKYFILNKVKKVFFYLFLNSLELNPSFHSKIFFFKHCKAHICRNLPFEEGLPRVDAGEVGACFWCGEKSCLVRYQNFPALFLLEEETSTDLGAVIELCPFLDLVNDDLF